LQLNLRDNFIRYGIITLSAIVFGIIYAILRLNGIENLYLLIVLTCLASVTGHYTYRIIRKRSSPNDLSYQRSDSLNLTRPISVELIVDANGILSQSFPPSGSIINYANLQENYEFVSTGIDREIYLLSNNLSKILVSANE
jgi:hypothetical protein